MKTRLEIVDRKLDDKDMAEQPWSSEGGAVVTFLGAVRGVEEGKKIKAIEYEANREMAEHQFKMLFEELKRRWKLESIEVIHRIGTVPVGEVSLFVRVIAAHRSEAFAACQFFIDQLKLTAPIWKKALAYSRRAVPALDSPQKSGGTPLLLLFYQPFNRFRQLHPKLAIRARRPFGIVVALAEFEGG